MMPSPIRSRKVSLCPIASDISLLDKLNTSSKENTLLVSLGTVTEKSFAAIFDEMKKRKEKTAKKKNLFIENENF